MRIAGYIEHSDYHITIFEMNHRFSLKIESDGLEQWYKLRLSDTVNSVGSIKEILDDKFWEGVRKVFTSMQENERNLIRQINLVEEEDFEIL